MMKRQKNKLFYKYIYICLSILLLAGSILSQDRSGTPTRREHLTKLYNLFNITYNDSLIKGISFAEEALALSKKLDNKFIQAQSLIFIGRYANFKHDAPKAGKALHNALAISREINNEYLEAGASMVLGYYYGLLLNKPDSGLIYSKRAYSLSTSINDTSLIKLTSVQLVMMYKELNDPLNVIRFSRTALEHNKNDLLQTRKIYTELALAYGDSGSPTESLKYFELTLKLSEKIKDDIGMANVSNNLANIYSALQKPETSAGYRQKALAIYTKMKNPFGIGYTYNCLGMNKSAEGKSREAIKSFQYAIGIFRNINNRQSLSFALSNLASEYVKLNKPDSAWSYLKESLSVSEGIKDKLAMVDAYAIMASYLKKKNKIDESIKYLLKGERLAKEMGNLNYLKSIYNELSFCYDIKNDSKKAFYYLRLKEGINDTIQKKNPNKAIIEMMVNYETARMKEEADKSKSAVERFKAESKKKSLILWGVITGIILFISIILLLFWKKFSPLINLYRSIIKKPFTDKRNIKSVLKAADTDNSQNAKINSGVSDAIIEKLDRLMNEEKAYLNNDLTLGLTAEKLETNTAYLSHIINEQFGMNFSNYLNKYRIEEAKRILSANEQNILSFEGIANSCGFKSRSSFNQAFKRFTGITPTEYSKIQNKTE
jgi:AraC-like DNA-binding protein